jgi:hypothetical protein
MITLTLIVRVEIEANYPLEFCRVLPQVGQDTVVLQLKVSDGPLGIQ